VASTKREKELARQRAARKAARREERARVRKRRSALIAAVVAVLLVLGLAGAATLATRGDTPGGDDQLSSEPGDTDSADAEDAEPGSDDQADPAAPDTVQGEPVVVGECTYRPESEPAREVEPPGEQDLVTEGTRPATISTDQGDLTLELLAADAPCAVASFASLSRQDFYADTPCHRLVTGGLSVLQCGDPTGTGTGGPGYVFDEENLEGATYPRGTVAMAKTQAPGSSGSQFFLVFADTDLPPEYTPFARITGGLEVLDAVAEAGAADPDPTTGNTAPNQPVQITSVEVG
jgi:peptidyl-prolyl cis-trans isomerase B (cyclophilin B)